MKIDVIAKVDGVHAITGLGLIAGETYTITEDQFGDEVFRKVLQDGDRPKKKRVPALDTKNKEV